MPPATTAVPTALQSVWRVSITSNKGFESPSRLASSSNSRSQSVFDDDYDDEESELDGSPLPFTPITTNSTIITTQQTPIRKRKRGQEVDIQDDNGGRRPALSNQEHIILLKICMRLSHTYRTSEAATFFRNVTADWQLESGKEHDTLRRVLRRSITARRKYLAELGTGEQDGRTERQLYEDSWIAVLDAEATVIQQRREHRGAIGAKTEASVRARASLLTAMKEKRVINPPLPSPRNRIPTLQVQELAGSEANDAITIGDDDDDQLQPYASSYASSFSPPPSSSSSSSRQPRKRQATTLDEDEVFHDREERRDERFFSVMENFSKAVVEPPSQVITTPHDIEGQLEARLQQQEKRIQAGIAAQLEDLRKEQMVMFSSFMQQIRQREGREEAG
ncbi:hypothetical protein VC83_06642 [Pseudogymnoascus destructans]|uniref:Uncharacterized protein n=1 Tax=Pseudogymnoascus destructans TaxID=655981 RepID=A0A177A2S8_9PEZI|nr:uncharacterized protein VC83_06642 [Pseudogymnoascus destructans]OAF56468.1 hypothetical protein VC83_06642 [Pseudogymnoascus destructans]